jgi:hypothetical protein
LATRASQALFFEGKFLGTSELTSPPSNVNNRLTEGVKGYFFRSSRFAQVWNTM